MMNLQDNFSGGQAIVEYGDGEFTILKPGAFVLCAVTGVKIPLQALKYWSVDKQEAYVDAAAAIAGFGYRERK